MPSYPGYVRFGALVVILVHVNAQDLRVTSSHLTLSGAARVSWGSHNNLLAFDRVSANGFYDVYTSQPDGSGVSCLTCNAPNLPPYNKGNPEWHPSNAFLAIQVQQSSAFDQNTASPGVGVKNDLYIADASGKNYWPVTQNAPGVLHPRFSHDGNRLLWVQRTSAPLSNAWNLMLADFSIVNNAPQITNIQSLPPCQQNVFCETGGFSADDSAVFFTGALDGQGMDGIDIYSYNLSTRALVNLTNSPANWDEFPTSVPGVAKIVWTSGSNTIDGLETEYWMMNDDGSNRIQLTYFNDARSSNWYLGPVSVAKFSWSPDASSLAAYLIPYGSSLGQSGNLYTLQLEAAAPTVSAASYARPPLSADSIATTFYENLATGSGAATSTTLPTQLAGTSIAVTDASQVSRLAPLFFVAPGQVNWEIPTGTAAGPATVQFTNGAGVSSRATVNVEAAAPGIFTANATGAGPPAGYALTYSAGAAMPTSSLLLFDCTASPACNPMPVSFGSSTDSVFLVLFGTGIRHGSVVSAILNGQTLPVSFAGAQGGYPGLDQVNISLPRSFAGLGLVRLQLEVDGLTSNSVQLLLR